MDPQAAKMIGAGIACIGMGGAGVGVGTIFGHYLAAALRNPQIDESGTRCTIQVAGMQPILISIDQYSDGDGNAVEPDSPDVDHRVVSILPA